MQSSSTNSCCSRSSGLSFQPVQHTAPLHNHLSAPVFRKIRWLSSSRRSFSSPSGELDSGSPVLCYHLSAPVFRTIRWLSSSRRSFSSPSGELDSGSPVLCLSMDRSQASRSRKSPAVEAGGYSIEGISIGGHETCVMVPTMKVAFDIGRCPQRAISQDFLLISHAHMDHIGGIAMYIATRGLYKMKPPTVIVPKEIKSTVAKLIDVYRELDGTELKHILVGLDIGEEYEMGKNYVLKAFQTHHVVPSQGYIIYSVKKKLKVQYLQLSGDKIKELKNSGVEITNTLKFPEIAFTGDTTAEFILNEANHDVLRAKVLIMEATFLDDAMSVEHAREYGHTHLSEVAALAERFENECILLIHFSARYDQEAILKAVKNLPPHFKDRVVVLLEGF